MKVLKPESAKSAGKVFPKVDNIFPANFANLFRRFSQHEGSKTRIGEICGKSVPQK
jgi:hypothetical protein